MKMIFVRHGQDDDRYRGGWSSLGLVEEGKRQTQRVASYFQSQEIYKIQTILSSDLNRTLETAGYLSDALGLPVIPEPQLRETNNGDLAGMLNEVALVTYPGLFFSSLGMEEAYPNGESPGDFYRRVKAWFETQIQQARHHQGDLLIVTHGGVINILYHLVRGLEWSNTKRSFPIEKCSIHVLDVDTMRFEAENFIVW